MLDEQPHRVRAFADQSQRLVDDVEVIHRVVIADDRAQVRAVASDHAIALPRLTHEGFGEQPATAVGAVKQVATATGAKPGGELYVESLSDTKGPAPTYEKMFRYNVDQLSAAMAKSS